MKERLLKLILISTTVCLLALGSLWGLYIPEANSVDPSFVAKMRPRKAQTITWNTQPAAMTVGDPDQDLTQASASSGLAITYSTDTTDYCTVVAGPKLHAVAEGTCVVHADQAGDGRWFAAAQVDSGNVTISAAGPPASRVLNELFETTGYDCGAENPSGSSAWTETVDTGTVDEDQLTSGVTGAPA